MNNNSDTELEDLNRNEDTGQAEGPVKERVKTCQQAVSIVQKLLQNDLERARRRELVQGAFNGNAPKAQADMDASKRGNYSNINWKEHRGTIMNAWTPYFDLVCEIPVCIDGCLYAFDSATNQAIVRESAEAFHEMLFGWEDFDYLNQLRDLQMLLHGPGPLFWEDEWNPFPQPILASDFYVDSMTKSTFSNCEVAVITCYMKVGNLWREIENPERAKAMKWNVESVRNAIMNASTSETLATMGKQWDRWEQMFKNGDIWASTVTKNIKIAHMLVQEMDGRITHLVFCYDLDQNQSEFLYKNVGRYDNWKQCLQVFLYDIGADGTMQSVKGLGTDIFPFCALYSKINNQIADLICAGTGPLFQPAQGSKIEDFSMAKWGIGQMIPPGLNKIDLDIARSIQPAIEASREFKNTMGQNNGSYSHGDLAAPTVEETAKSAVIRAMERSKMTKGAHNRFYRSLDWQYAEIWRRAINPKLQAHHLAKNPEVKRIVMEFREKLKAICDRLKVPISAIQEIKNVKATRSIGLGSPAMRIEIANAIMEKWSYLPTEEGKINALKAYLSALTSFSNVSAFVQAPNEERPNNDDESVAAAENGLLGTGTMNAVDIEKLVTPRQDSVIHLEVHIASAEQDAQAVMEGQIAPEQALVRLMSKTTHSWRHMATLEGNPVRKGEYDAFADRLSQLGEIADQLQQNIEESQPEQPQEQPSPEMVKVQGTLALKEQKQQGDYALKIQKFQFERWLQAQKLEAENRRLGAKTLSETVNRTATTVNKIALDSAKAKASNGNAT